MGIRARGLVVAGMLVAAGCGRPGGEPPALPKPLAETPNCAVEAGKLPPGKYEGPVTIDRKEEQDRDGGRILGTLHDVVTENGAMIVTLWVSSAQELTGAWAVNSALTTKITILKNGEQWFTPGELFLHRGAVAGNASELHLTGGAGMITHYPGGGIVTRYPIVDGVVDYTKVYNRKDRIDLALKIDNVSCTEIRGTVAYPVAFGAGQHTAPQQWVAKRTPAPCDEEPKITLDEQSQPHPVPDFDTFDRTVITLPVDSPRVPVGRTLVTRDPLDKYKTSPQTGLVTKVNLSATVHVTRATWQPEGAVPSEHDVRLLDKAVELTRIHEDKHVANYIAVARKYVCESHGKTVQEMLDLIQVELEREYAKNNCAIHQTEGTLHTVREGGKPATDVVYISTDEDKRC